VIEFGHFSLALAWVLAVAAVAGGFVVGVRGRAKLAHVETLRRMTIAVAICLGCALVSLGYGFVTNDYSVQYVWQYSNRDMPWIYKITAIWGGMDGSMLLWCFLVAGFSALVAKASAAYPRPLTPFLLGFLNTSPLFFTTITLFYTNPFRYLKTPMMMPDGNGLNPLLQNEYMAIHPPMLYLRDSSRPTGFGSPAVGH